MNTTDGGPAFPPNAGWRDDDPACRGMTLRDWFAGMAMQGWLASSTSVAQHPVASGHADVVASEAYAMADAMLKARQS